jgi:hypothetical protein
VAPHPEAADAPLTDNVRTPPVSVQATTSVEEPNFPKTKRCQTNVGTATDQQQESANQGASKRAPRRSGSKESAKVMRPNPRGGKHLPPEKVQHYSTLLASCEKSGAAAMGAEHVVNGQICDVANPVAQPAPLDARATGAVAQVDNWLDGIVRISCNEFDGEGLVLCKPPSKPAHVLCTDGTVRSIPKIKCLSREEALKVLLAWPDKLQLLDKISPATRRFIMEQVEKHVSAARQQPNAQSSPEHDLQMSPQSCIAELTGAADLSPECAKTVSAAHKASDAYGLACSVRAYRLDRTHKGPSEFRLEWERPRFHELSWKDLSKCGYEEARERVKYGCIIEESGFSSLAYLPTSTWKAHWQVIGALACLDDEFRTCVLRTL